MSSNITGLDELLAHFDNADAVQAAGDRAMQGSAEELADAIRAAAPEHQGELRDSVRVERAEDGTVQVVAGGTPGTSRGPGLDVALMTEWGTAKEGAHPFFWPTVEAQRAGIKAGADAAMSSAMER